MNTTVKICGLKQPEMVRAILHLPIDHIGFVFAKSKRQVTPQQASEMLQVIEEQRAVGHQVPLTVGVFVDPTREELTALMKVAKLDVIQLHSKESAEQCEWIKRSFPGVQVWKVISVTQAPSSVTELDTSLTEQADAIGAVLEPYKASVDAILLDTHDPIYGGGSGKTFVWDAIPPYQQWCRKSGIKLLVAGGLQPDNVRELVMAFAPDVL
jgi:phosphoribosylanthranilate isomerase